MKFEKVIRVIDSDNRNAENISNKLGISKLTSKILVNRGVKNCEEAEIFLNPTLNKLHNPFLLKDMNKAVDRICQAIENDEEVWIYGDYDVDGVTSTSILMIFLNEIGLKPKFYIPDRMTEGYGLNQDALKDIKEQNGQLIITVDCGITSFEEAKFCKENNLDVIITDHHQCKETLPEAYAVVNPNRNDCAYPFKKLAGVGVAFKLIHALAITLEVEVDYNEILPIVAIGTVADVVSLTGENRVIVKNGLDLINKSLNLGIKALLEMTSLSDKEVTSGHIGFVIGPRINAGGRIGLAKYGVELFLSDSIEKAKSIAKKLDDENKKRQMIEQRILKEAIEAIENDINLNKEKIIVIAGEDWHHGVIGIVSSRITERYCRPSILISIEGDEGRGSARSISSFDMYEGLSRCKNLFVKFGGHSQAAGLSLYKDHIPILREKINTIADELLTEEDLIPEITVDSIVSNEDININVIKEIDCLKPFGVDNPSPQLLLTNSKIKNIRSIGKDGKHLKLTLVNNNEEYSCVGFNLGELCTNLNVGDIIDVVVSLEINEYMGNETLQLNLKDVTKINTYNNDIDDLYFTTLIQSLNNNIIKEWEERNQEITFCKNNNRLDIICEDLKKESGILVLVNNYFNLQELLSVIRIHGRKIIKKTDISYGINSTSKENSIIVNPFLDKININTYNKIYLLDLFFDVRSMSKISKYIHNNKLNVLSNIHDVMLNKKILDVFVPNIDDLRIIYKSFLSSSESIFKFNVPKYITSLRCREPIVINIGKLKLALEILNESELLDFKFDCNSCFIKMRNKSSKKIDLTSIPKFKYYTQLKNSLINILNDNCYS